MYLTEFVRYDSLMELEELGASAPVAAVQAAVLHRFSQVFGGDGFGMIQIGDGAGGFQNPVMGAGAQTHAPHG